MRTCDADVVRSDMNILGAPGANMNLDLLDLHGACACRARSNSDLLQLLKTINIHSQFHQVVGNSMKRKRNHRDHQSRWGASLVMEVRSLRLREPLLDRVDDARRQQLLDPLVLR